MELGRLRSVDPRSVWRHEALDLTPWLLQNADTVAEVLGIDLELSASEFAVGAFAVDLVGRDLTHDCPLIVENQLEATDHDHLGKLVTYAAGTEARTVVWIATAFRDEHRQALDLLNELAQDRARFFGVELAVVRIGDSIPAPQLRLRAQPNDWHARVSSAARSAASSGRAALYQQFWVRCLERLHAAYPGWTRARTPGGDNWLELRSPIPGLTHFSVVFAQAGRLRVELYVDDADHGRVSQLYGGLLDHRERIERAYGAELVWEELPSRRASRIAEYTDGDVSAVDDHERYLDWIVDRIGRLRVAVDAVHGRLDPNEHLTDQPDVFRHGGTTYMVAMSGLHRLHQGIDDWRAVEGPEHERVMQAWMNRPDHD